MQRKTGLSILRPAELAGGQSQQQRVKTLVAAFGGERFPDAPVIHTEQGDIVPTIEEEIVYRALQKERDSSRGFQSLLDMQKLYGEQKDAVEVSVSLVDQDLMRRSLD